MSEQTAILVEGVSKKFCRSLRRSMLYGTVDMLKNMVGRRPDLSTLRKWEFWALKDVSFRLKPGECMGVVGQNGSGKSTLLRLLAGILPPTEGRVLTRGRVGALIALGAGFHPQMTGRENIYLNGAILGMRRNEVRQRFDEIIAFADIGDFIDAPVSTYSSGMHMRLGFSIAVHSSPSILLADEVLAVGDLPFALKSYRKIAQFKREGGTILLVSHSLQLIRNSCQSAAWLENGSIRMIGPVNEVCDEYEKKVIRTDTPRAAVEESRGVRVNNDPLAQITGVETFGEGGVPASEFSIGTEFRGRIHYRCERTVVKPLFVFAILTAEKLVAVANYSTFDGVCPETISGTGYVDFLIERLPLKQGTYFISAELHDNADPTSLLDWHELKYSFSVVRKGPVSYGLVNPWPTWQFGPESSVPGVARIEQKA